MLEMLIALSLTGIVAVFLSQYMVLGARFKSREQVMSGQLQPIVERILLREMLSQSMRGHPSLPVPIYFEGNHTSFTFFSASHPYGEVFEPITVLFKEGHLLVSLSHSEQTEMRILVESAEQPVFRYAQLRDAKIIWQDSWPKDGSLPYLVQITVPSGSSPIFPEFTAAVGEHK